MTTDSRSTVRTQAGGSAAWLILGVLLLFSIAAPLNQFKVPPIMPILIEALGVSVTEAGLLMSVYAITGLILALPAGLILQKAGYRVTGLLAGGSIVAGAILGALSTGMGGLLGSRAIEGVGTSLIAVLAPAIIAQWFVARRRGTAMGIWAIWVPVGTSTMLLIAPTLAQGAGWRTVWWLGAGYAFAATVLYLAFVRSAPAAAEAAVPAAAASRSGLTPGHVLRNRNIWLLAAAFAAMNAAIIGLSTYLPTFLTSQRGLSLAQASQLASITTILSLFSAPAGGILSDRIGSRKKPYLVGFGAMIVLLPLMGALNVAWLIVLVVVNGLVLGMIPTNIFAGAVEAAGDERLGGTAMSMIMVGQNAGMLLGPIVFGALAEGPGWPAAFISLAVTSALGLLAGWLARIR